MRQGRFSKRPAKTGPIHQMICELENRQPLSATRTRHAGLKNIEFLWIYIEVQGGATYQKERRR